MVGRARSIFCTAEDRTEGLDPESKSGFLDLLKYLTAKDLDVKLPLFTGDATEVRKANQENLATCDALVLYYGTGDEIWKNSIESELRKMPAFRSAKRLLARSTYFAMPTTDDKKIKIALEVDTIDGLKGFSEAEMEKFIEALA